MNTRLVLRCLVFAGLVGTALEAQSQMDSAKFCVQALKEAARDEYRIAESSHWEKDFHDAFCEAVHQKQDNKSSVGLGVLAGPIFLSLTDDQSTLSDYDRKYCRKTSTHEEASWSYQLYASLVHGNPLKDFNICFSKAMEAGSARGLSKIINEVDACHFVAIPSYSRTSQRNPPTAKVVSHDEFSARCSKIPSTLVPEGSKITCSRTGWSPGSVFLETDQGPLIIEAAAATASVKPILNPPIPATDAKFRVVDYIYSQFPAAKCPGNVCRDDITVEGHITSVEYSCKGGTNGKDANCGFSFNSRKQFPENMGIDYERLNDTSIRWYRLHTAQSDMTETYTVRYSVPHVMTAEEQQRKSQFDQEMATYRDTLQNGPCAVAKKAATPRPAIPVVAGKSH